MERYYNFLLKIKHKVFFIGMLCIASYSGLLSQSLSCDALLLKEIPIGADMETIVENDLLTLKECGHDFSEVPSTLIRMVLIKLSTQGKIMTYGDLVSALESIQNDPEYKKSKKNAMVMIFYKLFISLLAISLVLYWGRIFFLQIKSKDKMDDILDKIE